MIDNCSNWVQDVLCFTMGKYYVQRRSVQLDGRVACTEECTEILLHSNYYVKGNIAKICANKHTDKDI